ncbi:MAG TPA: hypothetical protein VKE41_13150, partial [Roseiflexaceae bacterium]|nr:hypothetical protein [Roseiflexaceae bacterium]
MREALEGVDVAHGMTSNRNILLTHCGNTLYVHLHNFPPSDAVKLKPIAVAPRRATLPNTGEPISCAVEMMPSDHLEQRAYLRLRGLAANRHVNT